MFFKKRKRQKEIETFSVTAKEQTGVDLTERIITATRRMLEVKFEISSNLISCLTELSKNPDCIIAKSNNIKVGKNIFELELSSEEVPWVLCKKNNTLCLVT